MKIDILTVSCPSKRGIVAAISTYLAANGCAIHDAAQFEDHETQTFFMRVSFASEEGKSLTEVAAGFAATAATWQMD